MQRWNPQLIRFTSQLQQQPQIRRLLLKQPPTQARCRLMKHPRRRSTDHKLSAVVIAAMLIVSMIVLIGYAAVGVYISIVSGTLDSTLTDSIYNFYGIGVVAVIVAEVTRRFLDSKYNTIAGTNKTIDELPTDVADKVLGVQNIPNTDTSV